MARTQDEWITMADGVRLAATRYLPDGEGPLPALLEALPYRKDDLTAPYREEYHRFADEFGYLVCRLVRYAEATVRTESRMRIDSDADHVRIEIDVGEGDERRWSRRWERGIPRSLQ